MIAAAAPGSFNDADMLQIGLTYQVDGQGRIVPVKPLTPAQARSAMALWAVLASPLMIAADVRKMDADSRSVWLNKGLIAINQDPLAKQGVRVRGNASACQVWKRELANGDVYVVLYNNGRCAQGHPSASSSNGTGTMTVKWSEVGVEGATNVVELIGDKHMGRIEGATVHLEAGGSAAFRLSRTRG